MGRAKEIVKAAALWVIAVVFLMFGLVCLIPYTPEGLLPGILFMAAAVFTVPVSALQDALHDRNIRGTVKVTLVIVLFFAGCFLTPKRTETQALERGSEEIVSDSGVLESAGEAEQASEPEQTDPPSTETPQTGEPAQTTEPANEQTTESGKATGIDKVSPQNEAQEAGNGAEGETDPAEAADPEPGLSISTGQKNALRKSKDYLAFAAFSQGGLKDQLVFEGFSDSDAAYGAENCGADWNEQAVRKAKSYLSFSGFSHSGLIEQLEYEQFTSAQAAYGADNCGADWNEQAAKKAKSYLDMTAFSRDGLIEQLEFEGFTHEQAVYGASANGY